MGVLTVGAPLFGVHIRAPDLWKRPCVGPNTTAKMIPRRKCGFYLLDPPRALGEGSKEGGKERPVAPDFGLPCLTIWGYFGV